MLSRLEYWKRRFEEHLYLRGLAARTVTGYSSELKTLFRFLEERGVSKLSEVTRDCLEAYRLHLYYSEFRGKRLGLGSQARRIAALKSFFRFLTRSQLLLVDPSTGIQSPKVPRTLPRELLGENEMERLLQEPDIVTPLGIRDRAILELLYATGLRNTELRELEMNAIDLERSEVFIARGKGNKSRRLPLGEEACVWLEDYLLNSRPILAHKSSGETLFLSSTGNRLHRGGLSKIVKGKAKSCGLKKRVTPHLLRHACATHMLRRGAGVRQLQVLLGHSLLDTTQRYLRVDVGDLHRVVAKFHPREQGFGG